MAGIVSNAYTRVTASKSEFNWKIDNYSNLNKKPKEFLKSPEFKVDESENLFYLELYPSGFQPDSSGQYKFADIFLCQVRGEALECRCQILFWGDGEPAVIVKPGMCSFDADSKKFLIPKVFPIDETSAVLVKDYMELRLDVTIFTNECESSVNVSIDISSDESPRLDCSRLFLTKHLSDMSFRSKCGKLVAAHKAIVASASQVFAKRLVQNELENNVYITVFEYETLIEMLRYIYTGQPKETISTHVICNLVEAADTYAMKGLKSKCEKMLISSLTTENAISVHKTAYLHDCTHLLEKVKEFIKFRSQEITESDEMYGLLGDCMEVDLIKSMLKK
ncbi:speckle-type POZ protein-like [Trichogramma pretiosum]|uniref:speckle-type POZ protein-like n=1 Tax=Trichogramma pretiosum TaxID=7493 RepID=UPI000C71BF2E|nr:speckle-type POZ protein-like [Trichogramma pretiosum]